MTCVRGPFSIARGKSTSDQSLTLPPFATIAAKLRSSVERLGLRPFGEVGKGPLGVFDVAVRGREDADVDFLHLAPADYERKQTLVNAERFTTPELKEYEAKILDAQEKIVEIERRLFAELRSAIAAEANRSKRRARPAAPRRSGARRGTQCPGGGRGRLRRLRRRWPLNPKRL